VLGDVIIEKDAEEAKLRIGDIITFNTNRRKYKP